MVKLLLLSIITSKAFFYYKIYSRSINVHAIKILNVYFSFRSPEEIISQEIKQKTIDMHIKGSETYKRFVTTEKI